MKKERSLTGIEARNFILDEMARQDPDQKHQVVKLSISLAYDLLKLTPDDVGSFADELMDEGIKGLTKSKFYGYKVEIDRKTKGRAVSFGM